MANALTVNATILTYAESLVVPLSVVEKYDNEFIIPPNTTDLEVPLTGIGNPKVVLVKGARGMSVRLAALGAALSCNPLLIITNADTPSTLASQLVSNADTQPHPIKIVAAE